MLTIAIRTFKKRNRFPSLINNPKSWPQQHICDIFILIRAGDCLLGQHSARYRIDITILLRPSPCREACTIFSRINGGRDVDSSFLLSVRGNRSREPISWSDVSWLCDIKLRLRMEKMSADVWSLYWSSDGSIFDNLFCIGKLIWVGKSLCRCAFVHETI